MALRLSTGLLNKMCGISNTLLTNGTFTTDISSWTNTTGSTWSNSAPLPTGASGYALLTPSGAAAGEMRYTAALTVGSGQIYRVKFFARWPGTAAGNCVVKIGTTAGASDVFTTTVVTTSAWTTVPYDVMFRVPIGTTSVYLTFCSSNTTAVNTLAIGMVDFHNYAASLQEIFNKCFIQVYSGSQPTLPNNVVTGTLLYTLYSDGATLGLTWSDAASGVLSKNTTETWSCTSALTSGTAGWFRIITDSDLGTNNTTDCRIDGAIATSGAQLNMSSTTVTQGAPQSVSTASITLTQQ